MSDTQTKLLSAVPATTKINNGEHIIKVDANGQVTRISLTDLTTAIAAGISVAGLSYTTQTNGDWLIPDGVGLILIHQPETNNCYLGLAITKKGVDATLHTIYNNAQWTPYISVWGTIAFYETSKPDSAVFHCIKFNE